MNKLSIMPEAEDIELFLSAGSDKSKNDQCNKIRENIITHMVYYDDEYFSDSQYGSKWQNIKTKFDSILPLLCSEPYSRLVIKHMGGMSYNYDFKFSFLGLDGIVIKEIKVEFKHNNKDVVSLVQFLELYDKDCKDKYKICETSYAEFYYDNYLDKYLACDNKITETKPEKAIYLKNVYDIKYKHKFFNHLHKNKTNKIKEKKDIANESVKQFIETFQSSFQFKKITEKIIESQKNKVFLLWDCENFHIQRLDIENINISKIIKISELYFDVEVENFDYDIRVRLNWGNSNGLANPRWKFTFIYKFIHTIIHKL